jgi:hypothetical protein
MTSSLPLSDGQASEESVDTTELSEAFLRCIQQEAEKIQAEFDSITPMVAQARALLWLDTLARLHEAGLDEAIKANDPSQASAWTRDLALFEVVISLIRNIQPMDLGAGESNAPDQENDVSLSFG